MSAQHLARRSSSPQRSATTTVLPRTSAVKPVAERVLRWQQQAGNQAVVRLLQREGRAAQGVRVPAVQRKVASHRENADITTLQPAGTLDEAGWTRAFHAARARPSVAAYQALFRDIALTAGMDALGPGFVPSTVPTSDGKTAQPGLNITLDTSGGPGHTGWVDNQSKAFGVPAPRGSTGPLDVSIAIILTPQALAADKGLSLRTARHEMVHAWHKTKVLAALKTWRDLPARGRPDFQTWVEQGTTRKKPTSALDVALISKGAQDLSADTEVLAYVEGFTTDYHRRAATMAEAGTAFFELLGVVETRKLYPWAQASPAVRTEALTRLREYHATLDAAHQRLWKEWVDAQAAKAQKDRTGRRELLAALSAFVT